jgi:hypothetical protein
MGLTITIAIIYLTGIVTPLLAAMLFAYVHDYIYVPFWLTPRLLKKHQTSCQERFCHMDESMRVDD